MTVSNRLISKASRIAGVVFSGVALFSTPLFAQQAAEEVQAISTSLSDSEKQLVTWVEQRKESMLEELTQHVEMNTGTSNVAGLDRYRARLKADLEALGFATSEHSSAAIEVLTCDGGELQVADHLVATLRQKVPTPNPKRILLNGHMDTVFDADDEFQTLIIEKDGTLKGPGVADMKGGIVIMLNALRALQAQGLLDNAHLTVLFNSDEEIGSLGSRALIEQLAKQHDIGLVFEGTSKNKATRARKGLGQARLKVTGRESHAGGAHEQGVSANLELAHKIVAIEQLTDYERKLTVNTGVMAGGEKRNTVAGCADAYIDMRFPTIAGGEELKQRISEIAAQKHTANPNYPELPITESWAVLHRPAKAQNDTVDALIAQAMGISKLIGEPIVGTRYSGGGTDGSITQGAGLPTIDSLGMDGSGVHSSRETSNVQSLIARTKLAAVMLARHIKQDINE